MSPKLYRDFYDEKDCLGVTWRNIRDEGATAARLVSYFTIISFVYNTILDNILCLFKIKQNVY